MAVKDWSNPTPEEWDEILGGIRQSQKDFPPRVSSREPTEAEKVWIEKVMKEYKNRKK